MLDLQGQWLEALEAAVAAVQAAALERCLPPQDIARHQKLLAAERAWLASVDWSRIDRADSARIVALERKAPADLIQYAA